MTRAIIAIVPLALLACGPRSPQAGGTSPETAGYDPEPEAGEADSGDPEGTADAGETSGDGDTEASGDGESETSATGPDAVPTDLDVDLPPLPIVVRFDGENVYVAGKYVTSFSPDMSGKENGDAQQTYWDALRAEKKAAEAEGVDVPYRVPVTLEFFAETDAQYLRLLCFASTMALHAVEARFAIVTPDRPMGEVEGVLLPRYRKIDKPKPEPEPEPKKKGGKKKGGKKKGDKTKDKEKLDKAASDFSKGPLGYLYAEPAPAVSEPWVFTYLHENGVEFQVVYRPPPEPGTVMDFMLGSDPDAYGGGGPLTVEVFTESIEAYIAEHPEVIGIQFRKLGVTCGLFVEILEVAVSLGLNVFID